MIESKQVLIDEYVKYLRKKSASVFLGAGMSHDIFNIDWKSLIEPYNQEIKLPLSMENFADIPQYYINYKNITDADLKKEISEKFTSSAYTPNHLILAKLPINKYWTTNYDTLIENSLKAIKKKYDYKYNNKSFLEAYDERQSMVYKCHGDLNDPDSLVLIRDDYDTYEKNNPNLFTALENELCTNNILFLGYSFNDDNIIHILNKIKNKNGNVINHFFIVRRDISDTKQIHKLNQLEKKGIYSLLIDDYKDIDYILQEIYKKYMSYKVLVSGSAIEYNFFGGEKRAKEFIYDLGYELVKQDQNQWISIVNGNGLGIGSILYEGIAEATAELDEDIADYLKLYPFPKKYYEQFEKEIAIEEKYHRYREKMIDKCGVAFFIFGNKTDREGKIINADGVKKEFDIAVKQRKYVFPIGATGYMAKELSKEVIADFEKYNGCLPNIKKRYLEMCQNDITNKRLIENIIYIIDALAFRNEAR